MDRKRRGQIILNQNEKSFQLLGMKHGIHMLIGCLVCCSQWDLTTIINLCCNQQGNTVFDCQYKMFSPHGKMCKHNLQKVFEKIFYLIGVFLCNICNSLTGGTEDTNNDCFPNVKPNMACTCVVPIIRLFALFY